MAARLRDAEEEEDELDVDSARITLVLDVQEEEDDAAVPFPSSAWHGGVRWLGSVSSFSLRPWRL